MPSPDFKDRKAGLLVFGILEVILGSFCALIVLLMIVGMTIAATVDKSFVPPMNAGMMIPGVLFYALLAVWFIWMGIGSIKARRWARALLLVSSWIWLIGGINGLVWMLLLMPDMYGQMAESGQTPPGVVVIMKCVMTGFMAVFYVIMPGVLVLFYGSKNVKATCEFRDPHVRWTDKCPLPVLAVSLLFGCWAASMALMGFYGWAFPFFGCVLSGTVGALVALVFALLSAYVAWGAYRLRIKAWWCSIVLTIAWTLSVGITFLHVDMCEFYEKMHLPEQQMEMLRKVAMSQGPTMALFMGFWAIGFLGLLLYTKRYFKLKPHPITSA